MINLLEYALLSGHIYNPNQIHYYGLKVNTHSSKNIPVNDSWSILNDLDPTMHPDNPCFAALYVKFHNRRATDAVIAIRGTQSFTDAKVDFDNRLAVQYVQHHFGLKF
jgi:hypothetical protein